MDVGDGVTLGVGAGDAVPDGELPPLGGISVPDGTSVRAVGERANMSALVDAESPIGTRAGAGRTPTGGATSLGGPELASSASTCMGKGCRAFAGGSIWVQAVVAGCSGTLSFDGMPTIATIATTAKEPATTAISLASSPSRPISPRCLSVCEDKQFWTLTRAVTISAIRSDGLTGARGDSCRRPRGVCARILTVCIRHCRWGASARLVRTGRGPDRRLMHRPVLLLTYGTGGCTHRTKERRRIHLWGRPGSGQRVRRHD